MSFFIFPSRRKPQFYLSNTNNVIIFFINNFLFSGNVIIQLLINIIKLLLPRKLIQPFFKTFLNKESRLPSELSEVIDSIQEIIKRHKEDFFLQCNKYEDIYYIIRKSSWQRVNDKLVVILFMNLDKHPFAVAKVGTIKYKESIELEFNISKTVYNNFKNNNFFAIPEPITFYVSDKMVIYLEKSIDGLPFNNYLKSIFSKQQKQEAYIEVLKKTKGLLVELKCQNKLLSPDNFYKYFNKPIEDIKKTDLGKKHCLKLDVLKEQANNIQRNSLYSVWMHGDLWGGSILYDSKKIGVIDWEFFSKNGVPLWDCFSIIFHIGEGVNDNRSLNISDLMNYFNNPGISNQVDNYLLELSELFQVDVNYIPFLFQSYLIFNMNKRDTATENYWQKCLEYYWDIPCSQRDAINRLL